MSEVPELRTYGAKDVESVLAATRQARLDVRRQDRQLDPDQGADPYEAIHWDAIPEDIGLLYHPPAPPGIVVGPYPDVNAAAAPRVAAAKAEGDRYRALSSTAHLHPTFKKGTA